MENNFIGYELYTKTDFYKSYTQHEFYILKNNNLRLVYRFQTKKGKYGFTRVCIAEVALDKSFYRENRWQDANDNPNIKTGLNKMLKDITSLDVTYFNRSVCGSSIVESTGFNINKQRKG